MTATAPAPHAHVWVFDWENPPGYVCSAVGCDAFSHACRNCEEPSTGTFCSEACACEDDERRHADDVEDDDSDAANPDDFGRFPC